MEFRSGYRVNRQLYTPGSESRSTAQAEGPTDIDLADVRRDQASDFCGFASKPLATALSEIHGMRYPLRSTPSRIITRRVAACRRAISDCAKFWRQQRSLMRVIFGLLQHAKAHPEFAHLQMRDETVRAERYGFAELLHRVLCLQIY